MGAYSVISAVSDTYFLFRTTDPNTVLSIPGSIGLWNFSNDSNQAQVTSKLWHRRRLATDEVQLRSIREAHRDRYLIIHLWTTGGTSFRACVRQQIRAAGSPANRVLQPTRCSRLPPPRSFAALPRQWHLAVIKYVGVSRLDVSCISEDIFFSFSNLHHLSCISKVLLLRVAFCSFNVAFFFVSFQG